MLAAGALARPYIANAAAKTATVWWARALPRKRMWRSESRRRLREGQRQHGRAQHHPVRAERQKIVSAITSGVVPDLFQNNPAEIVALYAWQDKLVDVERRRRDAEGAIQRNRADRGPMLQQRHQEARLLWRAVSRGACVPNHIWKSLVEKAGFKMEDIPKTWDAYFDFFKERAKEAARAGRAQGLWARLPGHRQRRRSQQHVQLFPDRLWRPGHRHQGRQAHLDDRRCGRRRSRPDLSGGAYREGYVPPSAINWNDADDNNAFHAKLMVMDLDGTMSTEVAVSQAPREDYDDIVTDGLPLEQRRQAGAEHHRDHLR